MLEQLRGKRNREPGGHRPARYRQGALQASRGSPRAPSKPAFELLEPVQDHVDLRDGRLVAPDHDEVLTVGRNVITSEYVGGGALVVSLVEKARLRNAKSRAGRDSDHHHLIAISVENLAALRAPYGLVTAVGRDLPLAPSTRVGSQPNLIATGLIGNVSDPSAVGREPREDLVEGRREIGLGPALSGEETPQIAGVRGIEFDKREHTPIGRPGLRPLKTFTLRQSFCLATPFDRLPEEIGRPVPVRGEGDAPAVRSPDREKVVAPEREPCERVTDLIPNPYVLERGAYLYGQPHPVRRKARATKDAPVFGERTRSAISIHLHERRVKGIRARGCISERSVCRQSEVCDAGSGLHRHSFEDALRRPGDLQPIAVERSGQKRAASRVDDMAGWRIDSMGAAVDKNSKRAALERERGHTALIERLHVARFDRKQDRLPVGKSLWPAIGGLSGRAVWSRNDLGGAS